MEVESMYVAVAVCLTLLISVFTLKKLLPKKSVDSILNDITQKIEDLHVVKEAKHLEALAHEVASLESAKLKLEAEKERDRALAVAEKLTGLIS